MNNELKKHAVKGGKKLLETYGPDYFSKISKLKYRSHWRKLKENDPEEYKKRQKRALRRKKTSKTVDN